ncbi:glycosyltransferase [Pseudanabaena sp. Chao 1811]|uniref:glycosyltransferase n=1 Tax=Pseudanabaena sp. Chao 1811 TaxID=2963092 RepID=UPI0022F3EF42|nr:glycosyltransferase [Pseudanabaena sp. Chao 1811]
MPTISVVIPSYNHEKYISEALQSVLDQTYKDFEIVITDDGSSDKSVNLIKEFTDPRIKLFVFSENKGACLTVNNCIENSTGKFIALLNSDDVFLPNKLEIQLNFLNSHPEIGAVFSYAKIINDNSDDFEGEHFYKNIFIQPNRNRFEWLNYFFYNGNCLCHPSILIRRECYENVGLYDPRFAQLPDFDFWIRLCQKYEIHIIPEELICFRVRDNEANASGNRLENHIRSTAELSQIYNNFLSLEVTNHLDTIFPEINQMEVFNDQKNINNNIRQYLIAKLMLNIEIFAVKYFALSVIFDKLNSKDIQNILSYKDFVKLTGTIDLYSITKLQNELTQIKNELVQAKAELNGITRSKFWKLRNIWFSLKKLLKSRLKSSIDVNANKK